MKYIRRTAGVLVAALALVALATGSSRADDPKIPVERYTLDNGLEVILHQDKSVPLVAVSVWYHVGSGNETPGKSGFAHLFEHMLFQGTKHTGVDQHFSILKNIGASFVNGSTSYDRTNYYEVVPSNQAEVALWLESDRMGYMLPLLNQQALDGQIEVVRNERRQRVDNQPYGTSFMKINELLFPEGHPYRYQVIGRHEDLSSSTLEDVRNFYKKWYAPANATLAISGDFELDEMKQLVDKWFGSFPASSKPSFSSPPMPTLEKTKRVTVEDQFAKLRQISYTWLSPARYADGDAEFDILAEVLGSQTGRLYNRLVLEEQVAQSVSVFQYGAGHSGTFTVSAIIKSDAELAKVEGMINQELMKVLREPISKAEFNRVLVNNEATYIYALESIMRRGEILQEYNHYLGDPDSVTADLDRYRNSSPADVLAAAQKWLAQPRVEVITVPVEPADAKGGN